MGNNFGGGGGMNRGGGGGGGFANDGFGMEGGMGFSDNGGEYIVKMRGLPFSATPADVADVRIHGFSFFLCNKLTRSSVSDPHLLYALKMNADLSVPVVRKRLNFFQRQIKLNF
jgi:hypothetical protein